MQLEFAAIALLFAGAVSGATGLTLLRRRRLRASTTEQKADHPIPCIPESEVRRTADGSIDIAFYKERAQRLRSETNREICRSIREFSRGWF